MKHELQTTKTAQSSGDSNHLRTLMRVLALTAIIPLLASCGASTEVEGGASTPKPSGYTGPAAATPDVLAFQTAFYNPLSAINRCGQCHTSGLNASNFPFVELSDVNAAYTEALKHVDLADPASSRIISKVAGGHNCWEPTNPSVCTTRLEGYINDWLSGGSGSAGRTIELVAPPVIEPGSTLTFPADSGNFAATVHPLLTANCSGCHTSASSTPQSPFFASADPATAYEAAKSKINLVNPASSNFVTRLQELHNCWSGNCVADAQSMLDQINAFIGAIPATNIDTNLISVSSKAMTLASSTLASGGSRVEGNQIALWEFSEGSGNKALDTSGQLPAMDLDFTGDVSWILGNGIDFKNGGYAKATTASSKKLADRIRLTNSFTIEAWVIPSNVTQEDARIISYTANDTQRNFSMSQTLYNYEFLNRAGDIAPIGSRTEGRPSLMTADADEDLQASLQHVAMTFDPVNGRSIFVNGVFTDDADMAPDIGGNLSEWDDGYTFILGNEAGGGSAWSGTVRMVAIHDAALTQQQIVQNVDVGVGQKYFMLFNVGEADQLNIPGTYVMFEVEQFDNTAYLFNKPKFISLQEPFVPPANIPLKGIRIAVNGSEPATGQAYALVDEDINSATYINDVGGQALSSIGSVIPVDQGPIVDEFFLTFEQLGSALNDRTEPDPAPRIYATDPQPVSDIGVKTFDEINATMSAATQIPVTNAAVEATFLSYKQQLPAIENISAFLASHQMAVAQLAMSYCNALVTADSAKTISDPTRYFTGFNYGLTASNAFAPAAVDQIMNPLLAALINVDTNALPAKSNDLSIQPDVDNLKAILGSSSQQNLETPTVVGYEYDSLVSTMATCGTCADTTARTKDVVTAMCAATLGSALTIIQ